MNEQRSEMLAYKPVPIEAARFIAEQFSKSIVVIIAWDDEHRLLHTATYGVNAEQKRFAARAGEIAAAALGADLDSWSEVEDFRVAAFQRTHTLRPISEYEDDFGAVLGWKLPVCEPPIVSMPGEADWPAGYGYFSRLPDLLLAVAADGTAVGG